MKSTSLFIAFLLLTTCSTEEADVLVSCDDFSTYEECEEVEHCVWQFSDLDPQTLQIMSPAYCRDLDVVTLDAGDFTISVPEGWAYTPLMGIDSTVGEFSNGEMALIFDYGMYTGDFSRNSVYFEDPSAYTVTQEIIDGFSAQIYVPTQANSGKPTVLSIQNINDVKPCTEDVCILDQENFEMLGDQLTQQQVNLALQIFRTVDFKN